MRPPGSALLLALAACSMNNPAFEIGPKPQTGGGGDDSGSSTTSRTTDPGPTTEGSSTTTVDPGTTSTSGVSSMPVTSTEPSTSDPTTGAPGPDLPGECNFTAVGDIKMYAYNVTLDAPMENCNSSETWKGPARMEGGEFFITDAGFCESMSEHEEYSLGKLYPSDQPKRTFMCAEVNVYWHPAEPGKCRIGTLRVIDLSDDMGFPYTVYAASFNYPVQPPDLPFWPNRVLSRECGCDSGTNCCMPLDAGEYKLEPFPGVFVDPGKEIPLEAQGHQYRFVNIQSHVDGTCQQADPNDTYAAQHFDWFGEEDLSP
jgi:hypothetical protein